MTPLAGRAKHVAYQVEFSSEFFIDGRVTKSKVALHLAAIRAQIKYCSWLETVNRLDVRVAKFTQRIRNSPRPIFPHNR
jgi:hypothetical protein